MELRGRLFALCCLFIWSVFGCGGNVKSSGSGGNLENARIDRVAMKAATAELNRLYDEDPTTAFDKLADFLRADPRFVRVREYDQMVVTVMAKGNTGVFMIPTRGPGSSDQITREAITQGSIPVNGKAAVMCSLGPSDLYSEYGRQLEPMLAGSGFQPGGGVKRGTLADYLRLRGQNLGLLYADTHGFVIPRDFDPDDEEKLYNTRFGFYLVCAPMDPNDLEGKALIEEYEKTQPGYDPIRLYSGEPSEVTWITAPMHNPELGYTTFTDTDAIGVQFIRKRLAFADHSIVYLNACYSNAAANFAINAGAGLFAGWSQPVRDSDANRAAERFFELTGDRQGGINRWDFARDRLVSENLNFSQTVGSPRAELIFTQGNNVGERLLPHIETAQVNESLGQITLRGTFGQSLGVVYPNDSYSVPLPIVRWGATEVVVNKIGTVNSVFLVSSAGLISNSKTLGSWLLAGNAQGTFNAPGRLEITIKSSDLQTSRLIYADPPNSGPGQRQPIAFEASPLSNPSDHWLVVKVFDTDPLDTFPLIIYSPSGIMFGLPFPPMYDGATRTAEFRFSLGSAMG